MIKIIKEEIEIDESLVSRLNVICDFCNTIPIINGSIRRIDKTNLIYIEPHRIYIKNNLYLAFNYSSDIYVNNLCKKIKLSELEVYKKQALDLELLVPNFKVASAIIHYDETSPHMHIVGILIKEKSKYGMSKQVGKSDVFTKLSLIKLQDEMRTLCIEEFNKEYGVNNIIKSKKKGRNIDVNVNDIDNYTLMKEQLEKNQQKLEKTNRSSIELKEQSFDIKELVQKLKNVPLSKTNYILKEEDKNKLIDYIDKVDKTNNNYQNIQELSVTLVDVDEELEENREKFKILEENIKTKDTRIKSLE